MNVASLVDAEGDWPATLTAYEEAVHRLRQRDAASDRPEDPLSWRFQAAMHGIRDANGPDRSNPLWCMCQHGSWFFLPWHRMYLCAFEAIVQDVLGDDAWSLPYWDAIDPDTPDASILPAAFRDTTVTRNKLHTDRRSILANRGLPFQPPVRHGLARALLTALQTQAFSTDEGRDSFGSGERSDPAFDAEEIGLLEGAPHGGVHMYVGNDYDQGTLLRSGWMGSTYTAALDPIFWLHHSNIDRLWQVWLDLSPAHHNPKDAAWLDTKFSFPAPDGGLVSWKVREVLATGPLGYEYESTSAPAILSPVAAFAAPAGEGVGAEEEAVPELLGATPDVPLESAEPVEVELTEPVEAAGALGSPGGGDHVYLRIEGITGTSGAPVYEVYVNVPPGDAPDEHPELRAGAVATFGIPEASRSDELHDGEGKSYAFDITSVRDTLVEQGRWDPERVQVSFSPLATELPAELAAEVRGTMAPQAPDLQARRVAVVAD